MSRFDIYRSPDPRATHPLYLDVQSDLVRTSTRWCVPLLAARPERPVLSGAQQVLRIDAQDWILDTPNILAMPLALLRRPAGRLASEDHLRVDAALDFMLRG